jgi:osmotically-inducible protein OsmY
MSSLSHSITDSTQRLVSLAEARLQASSYNSLHKISCQYSNGSLVLHGSVPSYFHKQMAQQAVRDLAEIAQIDNQIRVLQAS